MRAARIKSASARVASAETIVRTFSAGHDLVCRLTWYPPGYAQGIHSHDKAQISLLIAGELRETTGSGEHETDRPSVARKPEGARHSVVFGPSGAIILSWEVQDDALVSETWSRRCDWNWQGSRELQGLLRVIASSISAGAESFTAAESLPWDVLALLPEQAGAPAPSIAPPLMARLRERIRFEPVSFSVAETAKSAGIHRIHLARLFRRQFGSTMTQYRCRALSDAALRHILDPGKSLTEAALAAGFADQSHMTRMLKAETGFTPGALRRTMLGRTARA